MRILSSTLIVFLIAPYLAWAQPAGCVRYATATDVADIYRLYGVHVPVGTCLDKTVTQTLGLDTGAKVALQYLESKVCPGKVAGYDPTIPPAQLKETRVYFSANQSAMDPQFLVCAANFVRAAEAAGHAPCVNAAMRTQDHQRASCMDPGNTTVCGRTSSSPIQCRTDLSSCPHVDGKGMDLNSLNGQIAKIVALANSGGFGVKMGVSGAYDPWHMTPNGASCADTTTLDDLIKTQGGTQGVNTGTVGTVGGTVYTAPPTQGYLNFYQALMLGLTAANYVQGTRNGTSPTTVPGNVMLDPTIWNGGTVSSYAQAYYTYPAITGTTTQVGTPTQPPGSQSTSSIRATAPSTTTSLGSGTTLPLSESVRAQLIELYTGLIQVLRSIVTILLTTPR